MTLADADYPSRLRRVELPPPVLFVLGTLGALDRPRAVAVVGTRRPTAVGRTTAGRIADAVAGRGATVLSGLALGIDAAAHAASLRAGGTTVAVIGGGHERLYPAGNRGLARAIVAQGGAVVSEFPPATVPTRGTFPRRNRIISGLSDATVVVEAGARSGALTTAAWAPRAGPRLTRPGPLDDGGGGQPRLREAGPEARIVAGVAEVARGLTCSATPRPPADGTDGRPASTRSVLATLPAVERAAFAIVAGRGSVDESCRDRLAGATVLGALTALEVRGLVVEVFGRYRPAGPLAPSRAGPAVRRAPIGGRCYPS
jgi:DNA processing protein